MKTLKIALITLIFSIISCNTKDNSKKITSENIEVTKESNFKYWNWITASNDKPDSEYIAHFNKLKGHGIDAVLINTFTDPNLLKRLTPLANKSGLEVHAWMFTTNRPNDSIALQHPDWYMVSRSGKSCFNDRPYVDYYQWVSPSHPEARKHILSLVEGLAKVPGVASVHLDYIRYPDVYLPIGLLPKYNLKQEEELPDYDFDYSDASIDKFIKLHHKDPREMKNPSIDMEWKNFRINEIQSLVNEAYTLVHKYNKKLSAAVFPYPEMANHMVRQRWDKWNVDMVLPMIYYNFYNEELDWIGYATAQGLNDLDGRSIELHTGLFTPKLTPENLELAIQFAKNNGASGVAFFDNYTLTDEQLEVIKTSKH